MPVPSAIAKTNPSLAANTNFINAVLQAKQGKAATPAQLKQFSGWNVAKLVNYVYGSESPFTSYQYRTEPSAQGIGTVNGGGASGVPAGSAGVSAPASSSSANIAIPDELKNDPYFKQLDPDNQALIAYNWSVLASQNKDKIQAFQDALGEATKQADPYWAEKINIVTDQLKRTLGTYDADLASNQAELIRRRDYIQQQLSSGATNITAEQQAELARQAKQYDVELKGIGEQMANTGLTASTLNARARTQASEQNNGVVESINRTADKSLSDLNAGSGADLSSITAQLSDIQRKALEDKTSLIRSTESQVGSGNLQDILNGLGYGNLLSGGVTGSLNEDKATDIFNRTQALASSRGL